MVVANEAGTATSNQWDVAHDVELLEMSEGRLVFEALHNFSATPTPTYLRA
jgi:hypothetical protein